MQRSKVLLSPRLAGQVKRYHTWPTIQTQTNADHTFNVLLIWYRIWGPPVSEVTAIVLWHDLGEIAAGDPPFPAKANNPTFKAAHDHEELKAITAMGGPTYLLHADDKRRLKVCDLLEMFEFGLHEYYLGNQFAFPIIRDTRKHLNELGGLEASDWKKIHEYMDKINEGPTPWKSLLLET